MTAAETIALLQGQFGSAIPSVNAAALDPYVVVDPAKLVEICLFLRDDPRLKFEILPVACEVDKRPTVGRNSLYPIVNVIG